MQKEDANNLLDSINDAASTVSILQVTFLTLCMYIFLTVASTTDEMLLRDSPVTLPLLNVQVPIVGFYILTPLLVVLLHFELLLQFSLLRRKLVLFDATVVELLEEASLLRERLANFHYTHFIAGNEKTGVMPVLFALIAWVVLVVTPLCLLVFIVVRFLPYHHKQATIFQTYAVGADMVLLVMLGFEVLTHLPKGWRPALFGRLLFIIALSACLSVTVISLAIQFIEVENFPKALFRLYTLDLPQKVLTANTLSAKTINALRRELHDSSTGGS
jgi:hypothetical protein